jgi:hypothetical protein
MQKEAQTVPLPENGGEILLSNLPAPETAAGCIRLAGWQAVVVRLSDR